MYQMTLEFHPTENVNKKNICFFTTAVGQWGVLSGATDAATEKPMG